ncbi:MAG: M14 family zinc carboxypeptidase [Chloroflexota bacterium]
MYLSPPAIAVPDFWLANLSRVQHYLRHGLTRGVRHVVGASARGHAVEAVEFPRSGTPQLLVVGGTHGHEPGGVAGAMNLLHLAEHGTDLAGQPHEGLRRVLEAIHLYVIPCLNPDGRAVCPDSFHGQAMEQCQLYACGVRRDGSLIPYDSGSETPLYYVDPRETLFVGGQFNGAGYAANRRRSLEVSDAVEVQALIDFSAPRALDGMVDLHACGYNFGMQARSHEPPYWELAREWQRRAGPAFAAKGRPLGRLNGDGAPPRPPAFHFNAALFHRHGRLFSFTYEGRQGYLGRPSFLPLPALWEIVDDYLTAIEVFLQLGAEGRYAHVNREVFGG